MKKIQEVMIEEEKQRIPIAQGLPWTTDEPEVKVILLMSFKSQNFTTPMFHKQIWWHVLLLLKGLIWIFGGYFFRT